MKEVDCTVLPASEVFDQAHDETIFRISLHDEGRDLLLSKRLICFQAPLAAD
jgi:hypothetical protein